MSCFTTMSAVTAASEFDLTKHVNYTAGMILGVDDFTQEFAYLSGRDRWMTREALGYGTVSGLRVRVEADKNDYRVMIEPGVAISPRGQLICVPSAQCAYLNQWLAAAKSEELDKWVHQIDESPPPESPRYEVTLYAVLCYRDCLTDDVPIPGEPCRNENELMAASRVKDDFSLELRFEPPKQLEEEAVREYSDFLRQITISDAVTSTPIDDFLDALREEFLPTNSPSSPPIVLQIHPEDVSEYMRLAFRLWTTELRNVMSEKETGCAVEMTGGGQLDDCILLAEMRVPVTNISSVWQVSDEEEVQIIEENRPFLLHLRMVQEWMLNEPNDHGHLTGLEDDDHKQYLLIDGSRAMTGSLKMGGNRILNLAAGTANNHAVNFQQAVKVGDAAGGDLGSTYPNPTIAKLQGKPLSISRGLTEGQIIIFRNGEWVNEDPITDHGELKGLGDDDHKQYLPLTGSRQMTGDLKLGGNKITGLAAGTANGNAVIFEQSVKVGDAAGGDLGGTYPNPTLAKLMGKTLGAPPTTDGQVLISKGGSWVAETPASGGVTDHSALTGHTNDDHKQYLPLTGSRAMTGILKLGSNKITGLAAGTVSTDAVNFGQVVKTADQSGGDLSGTFSALSITKLQGKSVKATAPNVNDALVWNGTDWAPKAQGATVNLNLLPLATITRLDNNFYEIWFNVDAPDNLATVEKIPDQLELTNIVIEGENKSGPTFLTKFHATGFNVARNVINVNLKEPEMRFMRFTFDLNKIMVKVEGTPLSLTLAQYAKNNSIRFLGTEKEDFATVFVRVNVPIG